MENHEFTADPEWYGVRCVFRVQGVSYEERVTLWRARSHEDAMRLAEREAKEYARILDLECTSLVQSYRIGPDQPASGEEVFSLFRDSDLSSEAYIDRFFDTGREHQKMTDIDASLDP